MIQQIELTSEMGVTLIDSMGDDSSAVKAARVSIVGADAETEEGEKKGLLNFLMSNRHATPFEHCVATFMIEVPLFVRSEIQRHRTFSYNERSGRYSILPPKFYVPNDNRPLKQVGKPGSYTFSAGSNSDHSTVVSESRYAFQTCWNAYEYMLDAGIAKEVARNVLPLSLYTAFYMTGSLRNWINFLSLRTASDALHEIRDVAFQIEQEMYKIAPVALELWDKSNRGPL